MREILISTAISLFLVQAQFPRVIMDRALTVVRNGQPSCSAVILSSTVVLSAAHCIQFVDRVELRDRHGKVYRPTSRVLYSPPRDLVTVRVEGLPQLPDLKVTRATVGEEVWFAGQVLEEEHVVTRTIVSKVERLAFQNCPGDRSEFGTKEQEYLFLQAGAVSLGSSGGGVFNQAGELVGIVVRVRTFALLKCAPYTGEDIVFGFAVSGPSVEEFLQSGK